jgi:hypothetical protein
MSGAGAVPGLTALPGANIGAEAASDAVGVPDEEIGGDPTGKVEPAGAGAAVYCASRTPLWKSPSACRVPLESWPRTTGAGAGTIACGGAA